MSTLFIYTAATTKVITITGTSGALTPTMILTHALIGVTSYDYFYH